MSDPQGLMIAGLGRHTQDVYWPLLERSPRPIRVGCVVELASRRAATESFLESQRLRPEEVLYVPDDESTRMSAETWRALERRVTAHRIGGLIVATPPERHLDYALWGASRRLHLLVDKPLTTRSDVLVDEQQALGLVADSEALERALAAAGDPPPICIVAVHRRFHPAWTLMTRLLQEVAERVNCPITAINAEYSDGEWRLPHDVVGQDYHPYTMGFGILSHSGYHLIDAAMSLVEASQCPGKEVDSAEVATFVVRPVEQLSHIDFDDYRRLLPGPLFDRRNPYSEEEYRRLAARCGEMDAFVMAQLKRGPDTQTTATFQLHHNSLCHRLWVDVEDRNLYQGNGRLRHESYTIRQGPFQLIRLLSFQAAKESRDFEANLAVGGKNHVELLVYRNREVFGSDQSFRRYGPLDMGLDFSMSSHLEAAKKGMLDEFLRVVAGERHGLVGALASHRPAINMLCLMYRAAARRLSGLAEPLRTPFRFVTAVPIPHHTSATGT